ncbi:TPA: glycosyltransferase [Vibrio vulnificus]|nr:glycosyltransferase [Vibrio vulnificus]HDY8015956.1 glycosyltransferase [Vibrio vulnificus]
MKHIVINASNLHLGGGLQVACSFVSEIIDELPLDKYQFSFMLSSKVLSNLIDIEFPSEINIYEINSFGFKKPCSTYFTVIKSADVVFNVFGPVYYRNHLIKNVTGFAQAWIAYPNNEAYKLFGFFERYLEKMIFSLKKYFFFSFKDRYIVESDHVKKALVNNLSINESDISVVYNCISSLYLNHEVIFKSILDSPKLIIGVMGRAYEHKNLRIIKELNDYLMEHCDFDVEFVFTLNDKEMKLLGFDSIDNMKSVGELKSNECAKFYKKVDVLLFTSLLECFSVTPLEGLAMKVPVIASDRDFVHDVCKEHVFYVDPNNIKDIAIMIENVKHDVDLGSRVERGYEYVMGLPSASDRAKRYLKIVVEELENV